MNFRSMSDRSKSWIKGMRVVLLVLRVLGIVGGLGLLVMMIVITEVDGLTSWVLRITVSAGGAMLRGVKGNSAS
jgi:hypothetical protein